MEDNFRNVLIILSAIVITAIFIHGLWTLRKQKNPYKLKTSKDKADPITRDFDRKGFDQDGVGQVKVKPSAENDKINLENEAVTEHFITEGIQLPDDLSKSQIIIKNDVLGDLAGQTSKAKQEELDNNSIQELDSSLEDDWFKEDNSGQFSKGELGDELTPAPAVEKVKKKPTKPKAVHIEPLYEQPVTQAKPARTPINKVSKTPSKATLKRDQIEIDFDNQMSEQAAAPKKIKTQLEPQVIILSVVMPANQQMLGAALLPSLLTLGLKYGEMNIFHRHEDNAGKGKVTFSLANIMNPGSFDLDNMENFATRGVSLFMTLPNAGDPFSVFEQMLNAAKQLAQEFNAQVLDDKRNVMTKQTEQHYLSKIREFDRKSRIALVE
ncbi:MULTISPECIES: cell division protein ZipA [Colwellia]|uniref:Cell division protein ZipA n=1 Tax=Colwellia psychrerythraea (strain 34H / ATCC BAA-681) TaxID=167879 RepID=ZIPA_COLP3|nr:MULTISPECIES: cell division protein ZipA [Colwellia]Q47YH9.1 RecName: Full=Cell division protein ZipA [Colwellia psychrerythraea 34H]AAZ26162.1 putative cell division protein ZipA [Colwellia psychrerythraea 34H]PKH86870.1 cell division protein ZipA [Colwellia sp. Bg11-28]